MALPNVFEKEVSNKLISRIENLQPNTQKLWGKMSATQMLAHCNVTYEYIYEDKYKKPNFLMKFIFKALIKDKVVSEKEYPKSGPTGPDFIIKDERNFETEKKRLLDFIVKTQSLGESYFDGKESHSFGELNKTEWNNMLYKHLDHHLAQFGL